MPAGETNVNLTVTVKGRSMKFIWRKHGKHLDDITILEDGDMYHVTELVIKYLNLLSTFKLVQIDTYRLVYYVKQEYGSICMSFPHNDIQDSKDYQKKYETASNLQIKVATPDMSGKYSCEVSNLRGTVQSETCSLAISKLTDHSMQREANPWFLEANGS